MRIGCAGAAGPDGPGIASAGGTCSCDAIGAARVGGWRAADTR